MFTLMAIILIIVSILLIAVILVQPGKGDMISGLGGLSGTFSTMFGSRRTMDILQKITVSFAAIILFLSLMTNVFFVGHKENIIKPVTEGQELPIQTVPTIPGQQQPLIPTPED